MIQSTCALEASAKGNIHILQSLLEHGADIHQPNCDGRTALHIAILKGQNEVADFLLSSGANLMCTDIWDNTPFDECKRLGQGYIAQSIEKAVKTQMIKTLEREYRLNDYISSGKEKPTTQPLPLQRKLSNLMSIIDEEKSTPMHSQLKNRSTSFSNLKVKKINKERHLSLQIVDKPSLQDTSPLKKSKTSKSYKGIKKLFQDLIKGTQPQQEDGCETVQQEELSKPYGVANGILRGSCQVLTCLCECFSRNQSNNTCKCGHFSASHENLGTENLLEDLQHLNIVDEATLTVLIEKESGKEWPKILNSNLDGDEDTEVLAQMWKDEKKEWIISSSDLLFMKQIGQGASAIVYEGLYRGNRVAIKMINLKPNDKRPREKIRQEMIEEFNIMSTFKEAHVVKFYGVCVETRLCMVLEFCEQGSLFDVLQCEDFVLGWEMMFKWIKQAVSGVKSLHSWTPPIVHRDLKSLNLLIDENNDLKVADFGLSRFVKGSSQTTLAKLRGTYAYAAPEVYFGEHYSFKSDVYSLAIILWELIAKVITGSYHRPYGEYTFICYDFQIIIQVAKNGTRPTIPKSCPTLLQELVERLWNIDADSRPDSSLLFDILVKLEENYLENKVLWDGSINAGSSIEKQLAPTKGILYPDKIPSITNTKDTPSIKSTSKEDDKAPPKKDKRKVTKSRDDKVKSNKRKTQEKIDTKN